MCELIMRLSKAQLDRVLADHNYFWTLREQWRDTDHCIDIDKTWHAIHYIFTNRAWGGSAPAKWIIEGDTPIPELDGGYGSACYLTPAQVSEVNDLLVSEEELRKRYNPRQLDAADIYPHTWYRDSDSEFEYLVYHYKNLRTLYQKAAEAKEYVIMFIC
jgi:hypothetical protein